ncbi:MAG: right-handed parallel beta-helix repeat-containing protein, partial [Verrucomicrobiales bacterium]
GKRLMRDRSYELDRFPVYDEGFFGFRMVGTHHVYSNFRVHALDPAPREVAVSSIAELREAMGRSNQRVTMKPGIYTVEDLVESRAGFHLSGSHNHFDLSGVSIRMPISTLSKQERRGRRGRRGATTFLISGDHVTVAGCKFENIYREQRGEITDFGRYNQISANYPASGANEMRIQGDDIQILDCRFTVRGSSPYGYGNIYGIGGGAVVPLRKHCGIQISGDRITIDRCQVKMEAFGHAIYVQGGDQVTIRNTEVEGEVRPSNDLYQETDKGDLARKFDYKIRWPESVRGLPIPRDHMINLMEDGIRAYQGTGHMTVENCKVTKARGGIKLYMAKSATVSDCEVRDCVIQGYSLPSRGSITRSRGNAAYGPLLYVHGDSHSSQKIDLEILPSPHGLGDHPLAAIKGRGHRIRFTSKNPAAEETLRPIIIGYPLRFDFLSIDFPDVPEGYEEHFEKFAPERYRASAITLENDTTYPVVLGKLAQGNRISTRGTVRDLGTENTISSQP